MNYSIVVRDPIRVSIMMPAYNVANYIGEAIESVLAQQYPYWELLIVNDGSTDATAEIAAQYTDSRIRLINQSNGGEAAARNRALEQMRGQYVAFLDADDLFLPHHLATTIAYLDSHTNHQAVYTDGFHCDQQGKLLESLSSQRRGPFAGYIYEEVVRASDVFGPPICVVLQRQPIEEQNLQFDSNIVIGPDWDFLRRYAEHALFGYINEFTCLYRVHETNITRTVNPHKRALYLARCREKAIQSASFDFCSVETRVTVFYDLLINLLAELPERQSAAMRWPQFQALPRHEQARLMRLVASKRLVSGTHNSFIEECLRQARKLNPTDWRSACLSLLYQINPGICQRFLQIKGGIHYRAGYEIPTDSPFGRLV